MKRVKELEQLWLAELLKHPNADWDARAVLNELSEALKPDWHPASEPPDTSRFVLVRTVSNRTSMAGYDGAAGVWVHWSTGAALYGVNNVTQWHEIEVPEPPEVGA